MSAPRFNYHGYFVDCCARRTFLIAALFDSLGRVSERVEIELHGKDRRAVDDDQGKAAASIAAKAKS